MDDKELLELCNRTLIYDPETGVFTNRIDRGPISRKGDVTGTSISHGYRLIGLNSKIYSSHRIAFLMYYKYLPNIIDHINHNKSDNRIANLRPCTQQENGMNRGSNKNTTSKYKGVCWAKSKGKWLAQISDNGNKQYLGYFKIESDAAIAYNVAASKLFNEFAYLNKIGEGI